MLNTILNTISFGFLGDEGASLQNQTSFIASPAAAGFAKLSTMCGSNAVLTTLQTAHSNVAWSELIKIVPAKYIQNNSVFCFVDYKGRPGFAMELGGKTLIVKQKTSNTYKLYLPSGVEGPMYPSTTQEWNSILECFATRLGVKAPVLVQV